MSSHRLLRLRKPKPIIDAKPAFDYPRSGIKFTINESEKLIQILEKYRKIAIKNDPLSKKLNFFSKEIWDKVTTEYNKTQMARTTQQLRTKFLTLKKKIRRQIELMKMAGREDPYKEMKLRNPFLYRVIILCTNEVINHDGSNVNRCYDSDNSALPFEGFNDDNIEVFNLKIEKIEESYNDEQEAEDPFDDSTQLLDDNKRMVLNPTTIDASSQAVNQSRKELAELQLFLMEQDYNSKEKRESEYHNERMKLIRLEQEKVNLEIYLTKVQIDKLADK